MGAVARQAGCAWVISSTYVVAADGTVGPPSVAALVPDFMNLFKPFITELWPSTTTGSTTVHVWVLMSRTCVAMAASNDPVATTRPSGRRSEERRVGKEGRSRGWPYH